jgi:putative membrane protein
MLLPLGLVNEFAKLGDWGIWTSIPFCIIIGWIYIIMELVGDYSENPFAGLMFDVPMLSICRTIEIDLLQMSGETDLPDPISSKNGVLV